MNIVILITAKDVKEAQNISKALVEKKLIACANIVSGVNSVFWWEGKMDTANEALLICKTVKDNFEKIVPVVKSLHSYDVPEIIALPIVCGEKNYLDWINESVR